MDNYNYSPLIFKEIAEFLPNVIFTTMISERVFLTSTFLKSNVNWIYNGSDIPA